VRVFKVNCNSNNNSVEEVRDSSIIFVGNRKNTVERVKAFRDSSSGTGNTEEAQKRPSSKSKTKVLIAAGQI